MKDINLLPERYLQQERKRLMIRTGLLVWSLTFVIMVVSYVLLQREVGRLVVLTKDPQSFQENPEILRLRGEIKAIKGSALSFIGENREVAEIAIRNFSAADILADVGQATLDRVWLTKFTADPKGKLCELNGKAVSTRLVSEYMLELKRLPYVADLELVSMGKKEDGIDFELRLSLKSCASAGEAAP